MTAEVESQKPPVEVPTSMANVDALLARRIKNAEERQQAEREAAAKNAKHLKKIAKHDMRKQKKVRRLDADDAAIDEALRTFLLGKRKSILRRFGKTIKLGHGIITWVIRARDVDTTEDVTDAIRYLKTHPDGQQYLTMHEPDLNKRALATCQDENLLRALRRRGVRVSKHEFLSIKPSGMEKALVLSRRLYPRRK